MRRHYITLFLATLTLWLTSPSISMAQEETWISEDGSAVVIDPAEIQPPAPPIPFEGTSSIVRNWSAIHLACGPPCCRTASPWTSAIPNTSWESPTAAFKKRPSMADATITSSISMVRSLAYRRDSSSLCTAKPGMAIRSTVRSAPSCRESGNDLPRSLSNHHRFNWS